MGIFPKFFFIGDSLTQYGAAVKDKGWIAQLRDEYLFNAELVARGFSGYNTEWIKPLFNTIISEELTSSEDIRIVTILLGSNDATLSHREQHVPLNSYKDNLKNMIKLIKEALPGVNMLLITPPPMNEAVWQAKELLEGITEPGRINTQIREYAGAVLSLGQEQNVPVIDLWKDFSSAQSELFSDGLHLSEEGNTLVAKKWLAAINSHYPTLSPENLSPVTIHWSQMKRAQF